MFKNYSVTTQHSLDIDHMRLPAYNGYFDDTLAICEEFGLINIMKFNQNYIEEYITQFYATVYMHPDDARTMTWMTKDRVMSATMKEFGDLLDYEDRGDDTPSGWRNYGEGLSSHRDVLAPITMDGGTPGKTAHLCQTYEILHRIYRETITPRVGNWDEVHGYMIDLLKNSHVLRGKG